MLLKSGSPVLTVVEEHGNMLTVNWIDNDEIQEKVFPRECLTFSGVPYMEKEN